MTVKRKDGKEDLINIRFKKFSNNYKENDEIEILNLLRTGTHADLFKK